MPESLSWSLFPNGPFSSEIPKKTAEHHPQLPSALHNRHGKAGEKQFCWHQLDIKKFSAEI